MDRIDIDYIFLCPCCGVDTLHHVKNHNHNLIGIICSNCNTPSLVRKEILTYHQLKWEDELRQILNNLENPFDDN